MAIRFNLYFLFTIIVFFSCNSEPGCKFGNPTPIFKANQQNILSQTFEISNQNSTENVAFVNGVQLKINQSGCEKIEQIFEFNSNKKIANFDQAILAVIDHLNYFSTLEEKYLMYQQWAYAIQEQSSKFKNGKQVELAPSFNVTIDFISSQTEIILLKISN